MPVSYHPDKHRVKYKGQFTKYNVDKDKGQKDKEQRR
jgi:hypothetical protein